MHKETSKWEIGLSKTGLILIVFQKVLFIILDIDMVQRLTILYRDIVFSAILISY